MFRGFDLSADAPDADDPAVEATVVDLYRRLLARDPRPSEVDSVARLTVDEDGNPVTGEEFAALACVAVASSTEFLFL